MKLLLFDPPDRSKLFPLVFNRAVADLRMGIFTIKERWEKLLSLKAHVLTDQYLQPLYEPVEGNRFLVIDSTTVANDDITTAVKDLQAGEGLFFNGRLFAANIRTNSTPCFSSDLSLYIEIKKEVETVQFLQHPTDIFKLNDRVLRDDFKLLGKRIISYDKTLETNFYINADEIIIEEGAVVSHSILNAATGPIHIGKNATIMEGCRIRGPLSLGEGAVLKMGTCVYGATTIGPGCVVGGEIKNSVLLGYSNKGHEGYLGDSVIGEWCNFGAGTSNSNLKNTAGEVRVWNYYKKSEEVVGTKCGVIMGDYCRTAINSAINTGTIAGVCNNLMATGVLPKRITNFTWNVQTGEKYRLEKAFSDINRWKKLKDKRLLSLEKEVLQYIFDHYID